MIVLCIVVGILVVAGRYTLKRNQVVSYLVGRVIDLENGKWGITAGGSSDEAIKITLIFSDLSSIVIRAKRNKVYSIGEHLIIRRVVLFNKFVFYKEVSR